MWWLSGSDEIVLLVICAKAIYCEALDWSVMQVAFADNVYERVPDGIFELKWDYDPTLIFFAFLLIFYIRSLFLFKNKKPVKNWQVGLFSLVF